VREITVWKLGHLEGSVQLQVVVRDELGLTGRLDRVPAGWRVSGQRAPQDRVTPEQADALDELVRAHPILGSSPALLAWLGL
jgi:hypothetical protein